MPLESASYISQLEPSYPASSDPVGQADDHIRLLKAVLKSTFPNINGPVSVSDEQINTSAPVGLIALWYGSSGTVPTGWAICNGATVARSDGSGSIVTPNLTDKCVIGAGIYASQGEVIGSNTYTTNTGDSGTHTHTVAGGDHGHTGTVGGTALTLNQMPAHDHGIGIDYRSIDGSGGFNVAYPSKTASTDPDFIADAGLGDTHTHSLTINNSSSHSHTIGDAGSHVHSVTVSTIQPSMGLHYIMKV